MSNRHLRSWKINQEGFVLPSIVFAVAIMSIVVVASLTTSSDERRASRAVRESTIAEYTAEAGLRQTYGAWPVAPVKALNPGDSLDLGWQSLPNNEKYRAVIHRVDNGGLQEYNVIVQGRRTGLNGGINTVIGVVGGVPLFNRAIYGDTLIYLAKGRVDGFDSSLGLYNAATADSTADVFTNKNLYVQSNASIYGNVGAGGTLSNSGTITGTQTVGAAAIQPPYDVIPCPTTGYSPVTPELAAVGYTGNGVLNIASNTILNLTGTQYFFKSITFAGQSQIRVPGNPHVDLMVQDSIYMGGGSFANTDHHASDLSVTACGTPTNPAKTNYWAISGGADAYFSVYAPNRIVYATGNSDFYGGVISALFYQTGSANFHYDEALARAASPKLQVQKATWGQFPGN